MIPWVHPISKPKGISIGSAVFAELTIVTYRQTDSLRQTTLSVCNNRTCNVRSTAMRSKMGHVTLTTPL